jgi:hypothetical protein
MFNKKATIAALNGKIAELDMVDDQLMGLDATMPEGQTTDEFDLLSEKREQLEQDIRKMRERVQLISEWEKFKNGDWSEEVKGELKSLDQEFANIADGASGGMGGMDMGMDAGLPPDMPPAPDMPPSPDMPPAPAIDAPPPAPEAAPLDAAPAPTPDAAPVAAPVASKKNSNYEVQVKGSSARSTLMKGDTTMANNTPTPTLKEKMAEAKSKREAISKEAKTRVASAWTIAKTMLPTAPAAVQKAFAANLLQNSTQVLKAALRQTAVNAHNTKLAETFKEVHKVELNDLLEDPSVLNAEKKAVESEVKGEAKNAGKVADDRKDAGPQPDKYDDGRNGSEPKEIDASKAAERDMATINKSEGDKKSAAAKVACGDKCAGCEHCKKEASCADCKTDKKCDKHASAKKADGMMAPPAEAPAPAAPAMDAPPAGDAGMAPPPMDASPPMEGENPDAASAEILTDEKKMVVEEKIEEAQEAIKALESTILEESEETLDLSKETNPDEEPMDDMMAEEAEAGEDEQGEELDLQNVFNNDDMEEKKSSLANEGDEHTAGMEGDFFSPSDAQSMEASLDEPHMATMDDFFSMQGADGDPLASLMASLKTAEQVAGMEIVPSSTGEAAAHFEQEEAAPEGRDNESDHEGDLFAEAIENVTPEEQGTKRLPQDSEPKLEAPKASAKKATLRRINPIASDAKGEDVGRILFGKFEDED